MFKRNQYETHEYENISELNVHQKEMLSQGWSIKELIVNNPVFKATYSRKKSWLKAKIKFSSNKSYISTPHNMEVLGRWCIRFESVIDLGKGKTRKSSSLFASNPSASELKHL